MNTILFSLRRFIFQTESGVMCLDVHPEHPHLVAVGFYNGTNEHFPEGSVLHSIRNGPGSNPLFTTKVVSFVVLYTE